MIWSAEQQAEHRAAWVAALRSGDYRQVDGRLRGRLLDEMNEPIAGSVGYCCLGVACDLALQSGAFEDMKLTWVDDNEGGQLEWTAFDDDEDGVESDEDSDLPAMIAEWLGLRQTAGAYGETKADDREYNLAVHNDTDGYSFDQIADIIEGDEFTQRGLGPVEGI